MDSIIISELPVKCHVGVTLQERQKKQELLIDIALYFSLKKVGKSDDLKDTVCYSALSALVKRTLEAKKFHLIEAVAQDVAALVLLDKKIKQVNVTIKKPAALKKYNANYAAVEITRHG